MVIKLLSILLIFSFAFTQEPCEGTCLSEEETQNITNNIQELQFDLDKTLKINENLNSQIYMYIQSDSLNQVLLEGYKTQLKLKDEMIKVVKPKWYENKWLWFTIGVISTAGSIKLASELVD